MQNSHSFKFNLPEMTDTVDVSELNDNFVTIDNALMAGLCSKELTANNMGSSDPASRKYAWAPWLEITNNNEFAVTVTDRNIPDLPEGTITIEAGQTFRRFINGTYYMNFYVQNQHDVTFRWFTDSETRINEIEPSGGGGVSSINVTGGSGSHLETSGGPVTDRGTIEINLVEGYGIPSTSDMTAWSAKQSALSQDNKLNPAFIAYNSDYAAVSSTEKSTYADKQDAIDSSHKLSADNVDDASTTNKFVTASDKSTWNAKQNAIDSSHKLSSDLVDDTGATNLFVTSSEKSTWNGKQNEIDGSHKLSADLVDDSSATNKFVTTSEKSTWSGKQDAINDLSTIRSGATAGATAVQPAELNNYVPNSSLVEVVNDGAKNILYLPDGTYTDYDTTFLVSNGVVSILGNAASGTRAKNVTKITLEPNDYYMLYSSNSNRLLQCRLYTSDNQRIIDNPFTITTTTTLTVSLFSLGTDAATGSMSPMICTKSQFGISDKYEPYALGNQYLTPELIELCDSGAKNLVSYKTYSISDANITISNIDTSAIHVGGTKSTDDSYVAMALTVGSDISANTTYVASIIKSGTGDASIKVYGFKNGTYTPLLDTSTNQSFNTANYAAIEVRVRFTSAISTAYNLNVYPMICTLAAWNVSHKFVPYRVPITGLMSVVDKEVACSTTLTTTGIKFTATERAAYRITATAIYYNSIPWKLAIKYKISSSSNQGTLCTVTHVDGEDVSLTVSGIRLLDVGGEFEIFAQYANSTNNRFYVLVEKIG